ncbi:MAG: EamA family transporter [Selenomonadaceae bacterium]|nr:EamA family transporter [Selenomonadaceae bacterium]
MQKNLALILVGLAGILWASSGALAQDFFSNSTKSPLELTNIRMCTAGLIMLAIIILRGKFKLSAVIINQRKLWLEIFIYGLIGVVMVQFTYFQAISIGGAAATTVILSATPAMVVIWHTLYNRKLPTRLEFLSVILAMVGVFLLVTGGDPTKILVPLGCVFWSLASGAAFAFSAIFPKKLFKLRINPEFLISMGMFMGGWMTFLLIEDWDWKPFLKSEVFFDVAWIVIFGTVIAFLVFNAGLKFLTAEEATVTALTEPVASVFITYFMFGKTFGIIESVGIILVLVAILTPVIFKQNEKLSNI